MNEYYGRKSSQEDSTENESRSQQNPDSSLYSYSYVNSEESAYGNYYGNRDGENVRSEFHSEPEMEKGFFQKRKERKQKNGRAHGEKRKGSFKASLAKCAALALVFGLISGGTFSGVVHLTGANKTGSTVQYGTTPAKVSSTSTNVATTVTDVSDIVKEVMPSIVAITNTQEITVQSFFGQQVYKSPSAGSGIIIGQDDEQLLIVTNNHVVEDARELTVSFVDNETAKAEIKGTAPGSDLAVISVKITDIPESTLSQIKVAVMGDSDELEVGESAIAIGNALGYGQSVTTGVISALDRDVTIEDVTNSLIQTDAAINPGNSGGALLNMKGEVIGINSAKFSDTDVEGMGYAIPITTAKPIIENIISRETVDASERAYLGIYGVDVTEDVAKVYNMPEGIYVTQPVDGAAADKAGIVTGDIITEFDGNAVKTMEQLQEILQYYKAGTTVDVVIQRGGRGGYEEETVSVTLSSAKEAEQAERN